MREYLSTQPIMAIIFIILIIAFALFLLTKLMQSVGLDKIRSAVYNGFITAENNFLHGENKEKFEFVVELAKNSLPMPFNLFITETFLRKVIQMWFDLCKDLLDDGRINNSLEGDGDNE